MKLNKNGNIIELEDVKVIYRNFSGEGSKYNREGDRNFSVFIEDDIIAEQLMEAGFNVKIKPPRDEDEGTFMFLQVKLKFNNRGPGIYLKSGGVITRLDEDSVGILDNIDIVRVDLDIRPYHWTIENKDGVKEGVAAYVHAISVEQNVDRFELMYSDQLRSNSDEEVF